MNDGAALGLVLDQVSKDKNIDRAVLVETLEQAILTAAKRAFGLHREMEAKFNEESGRVDLFQIIVIVDQVTPGQGFQSVPHVAPVGGIMPAVLEGTELDRRVLELGPGPGLTTEVLAGVAPELTAIEIDPALAKATRGRVPAAHVVQGDATTMRLSPGRRSSRKSSLGSIV